MRKIFNITFNFFLASRMKKDRVNSQEVTAENRKEDAFSPSQGPGKRGHSQDS